MLLAPEVTIIGNDGATFKVRQLVLPSTAVYHLSAHLNFLPGTDHGEMNCQKFVQEFTSNPRKLTDLIEASFQPTRDR